MGMTVAEIREMLRCADRNEFTALERSLAADTRKGVRQAVEVCKRRLEAEQAEEARIAALYDFDEAHSIARPGCIVVGLDEVGRGAVAGPLAVGAVALPSEPHIELLNDSKQLAPEQRQRVAEVVRRCAYAWSVFYVEAHDIDRDGMAASLRRAFKGALESVEEKLDAEVGCVLVDGNPLGIDPREVNVVKGDCTSASIAAASIVAKVARDKLMEDASSTYPRYGFIHNKGYASSEHVEAIRAYGLCELHRASFCKSFMQETLF